jgi:small subunit ribosomal protein S16
MVRIRLRRVGGKGQPSYRIVAADKESPRDGRFLEILGFYNPRTEPSTISVKEDRVYEWMSNGAQPSESVLKIFKSAGVLDRYERYKQGEAVEALVAEAEAAAAARNINPKTEAASKRGSS